MHTDDDRDDDEDRDDVPWSHRTVPLVLAVVVAVTLFSLVSSSVRHQLGLSLTRQPQQYVEMSFGDGAKALPSCPTTPVRRVAVSFVVDSHLDSARRLEWTMTVSRPGGGRAIDRQTGTLASVPDRSVAAQGQVRLPSRGRYAVEIRLAGREERLRVNCQVPARG